MSSSANDMPAFDFQKAVRDLVESVDRNQDYIRKQFEDIDSRFDDIDSRFDAIDSRIDTDSRFGQLRKDINEDFKKALKEER